jgi:hypothetical protein
VAVAVLALAGVVMGGEHVLHAFQELNADE